MNQDNIQEIIAEFEEKFIDKNIDINGNLAYTELKNISDADEIVNFLTNALESAYSLGVTDTKEMVGKWCGDRCVANIEINGTNKWNQDLEEIEKLLST